MRKVEKENCPFCCPPSPTLAVNSFAFAVEDKFPVSRGHCLIIPNTHVPNIFDLSPDSYSACFDLLAELKALLEHRFTPDGFNVGINCGRAAGQTVLHAHIHIIPRYDDDVVDPTGGVRNLIPEKGKY